MCWHFLSERWIRYISPYSEEQKIKQTKYILPASIKILDIMCKKNIIRVKKKNWKEKSKNSSDLWT